MESIRNVITYVVLSICLVMSSGSNALKIRNVIYFPDLKNIIPGGKEMTQNYQVKVSMNQAAVVKSGLVLKQGDFGMNLEIEVLNFDVANTTPQIVFRKPMGAVESTSVTRNGNIYTYTFQGTELDTPGKVICDLKLKSSTTQRISSASFSFEVVADTLDGLSEQASSYSDTIEQLLNDVVHLSDTPGLVKNDGSINTTIEETVLSQEIEIADLKRTTDIIEKAEQFLDSTKWVERKYYSAAGVMQNADVGYGAYPTLSLPAGKYYYKRIDTGFSYAVINGVSSKPFTANQGTITFNDNVTLYITSQFPTTDFSLVMLANDELPPSYIYGVYDVTIPSLEIETNQIKDFDKSINEHLENVFSYSEQFLDSTKWVERKYYSAAGVMQNADVGYGAYPTLSLPAGKYYYKRIDTGFSYAVINGVSSKPFTANQGTITFNDNVTLYITSQFPTTDFSLVMLANDELPPSYEYGVYKTYLKVSQINKSVVVVDSSGKGDYTNIQDALDNISDTSDNPVTLLIMPGIYPRFTCKKGGGDPLRYVSFIGIDKNYCIIKDTTGNYQTPPAEIKTNGTIRNLSFIATNEDYEGSVGQTYSYAIHIDFGGGNTKFENCYLYSTNGPAIGIGMVSKMELSFDNCEFVHNKTGDNGTSALGAFYLHTAGSSSAVGQRVFMNNCQVINKTGDKGICLHELTPGSEQYAVLTNNVFWGTNGANADIQGTWGFEYSFGNNVDLN